MTDGCEATVHERSTSRRDHNGVKLKRRTAQLKGSAVESLSLAVELFNRPSQVARDQSVMLMLAHAFEMLFKAIIFQARGTIREKGEEHTYKLGRCINIVHSDLRLLDADDLPIVWAIKQDRNAAAHDSVAFSEDMLWLHVRSAVTIFGKLLDVAFKVDLAAVIPSRVIPVSALPPTDASAVRAREMKDIKEMLKPGLRRADDAKARIRPMLALDGGVTGREDAPTEVELDRAVSAFRKGAVWQDVFPGLAALEIAAAPGAGAQEVSLRISKTGEGPAVRLAKPGEEGGALLFRKSNPFDEYGIKLSKFGDKLGIGQYAGYALIWKLNLKKDPEAYFIRKNTSGNVIYQGLSAKALDLAKEELKRPGFNVDNLLDDYRARNAGD
jgi:hypothetical protein